MVILFLYGLSFLLHCVALVFGFLAWREGDALFQETNVMHFFKSRTERKFWTVCIGTMSNFIFIIIMPFYILKYNANATGWMEPWFNVFHLSSAFVTVIWHHMTYEELKAKRG